MPSRLRAICALLSVVFLVLVFFPPRGHAANTITVTNAGDGAANASNCPGTGASCRLRDAMAAAAAGDTINFSNTTASGAVNFFDGSLRFCDSKPQGLSQVLGNGESQNRIKPGTCSLFKKIGAQTYPKLRPAVRRASSPP